MDAVVFGNVTLDVICYPVNDVPRHESIVFEKASISPGGCGSNTAIGLAALGIPTGIVACTGEDNASDLLSRYWKQVGVDSRFVRRTPAMSTGTSVGLVDDDLQPRFIHTSGANRDLTAEVIDPAALAACGTKFFHIAGFFVLPNLFEQVAEKLSRLGELGITTSLDVVFNIRMDDPKLQNVLWDALPYLDYFMANDHEAARLTGEVDSEKAARIFKDRGARNVIIKLGASGCYGLSDSHAGIIPSTRVNVVDTTGAGDAFAAGFLAALYQQEGFQVACYAGNLAGAKICTRLGAITAWLEES